MSKHCSNHNLIKHHVGMIVSSIPFRNFLQDVQKGNIGQNVKDWVTFAIECFTQLSKKFSDRSLLMQVVIVIVIGIIVAVIGYHAYNIISPVIHEFLSHIGVKDLNGLNFINSDTLKLLYRKMKSCYNNSPSLFDSNVGIVSKGTLCLEWELLQSNTVMINFL